MTRLVKVGVFTLEVDDQGIPQHTAADCEPMGRAWCAGMHLDWDNGGQERWEEVATEVMVQANAALAMQFSDGGLLTREQFDRWMEENS